MELEIVHCRSNDSAAHPPILFVHGSYCAAWIWAEKFMPYFASRGFATAAVSLRGHGRSQGSLSSATLADYVEDVAWAAARMAKPPVLIGHSMGGLVLQHFLSSHPAEAAVLLSTVPPSGVGSSAMHLSLFAPDVLWQLSLLQTIGPRAVAPEIIHRAFFSPQTSARELAHLLPMMQGESHRVSAELLAPPPPKRPNGGGPPVLVIGGDADVFLPTSAFHETAAFYQADLRILQGAPHGLMLDDAWWQPTADTIIAWLVEQSL